MRAGIEPVAYTEPPGGGDEAVRKFVGDILMDEDTGRRCAGLSLIEERSLYGAVHRKLYVGVGEHQKRVLPAEL